MNWSTHGHFSGKRRGALLYRITTRYFIIAARRTAMIVICCSTAVRRPLDVMDVYAYTRYYCTTSLIPREDSQPYVRSRQLTIQNIQNHLVFMLITNSSGHSQLASLIAVCRYIDNAFKTWWIAAGQSAPAWPLRAWHGSSSWCSRRQ
jgi:hypothetical protein